MADRDWGSKPGSGGVASSTNANVDRRERLRQLALETIDLNKDPYFMKNHLGSYECKLCLTLHNNEGNYLAHTQGKRHKENLARRAAREAQQKAREAGALNPSLMQGGSAPQRRRAFKIGRPGYQVFKLTNEANGQRGLRFELAYPEIEEGVQPRHRFMSAFEQRVERPDRRYQYLLFAADPYETVAFKVPNWDIVRDMEDKTTMLNTDWSPDTRKFTLRFFFKNTINADDAKQLDESGVTKRKRDEEETPTGDLAR